MREEHIFLCIHDPEEQSVPLYYVYVLEGQRSLV